jgi:SAM-dependent methyltransferase
MTKKFLLEHRAELKSMNSIKITDDYCYLDESYNLKQHTIQNFGFEWLEYSRYGWDDPIYKDIDQEEAVFRHKSLLQPEDLRNRLILDAGCGNGRYSYLAAKYGGNVIGIDLGDGVEAARLNTKDVSNIQIVQSDIFNLPFEKHWFDVIFSIGVLMHTGDAKKAMLALADKLKKNGSILTVHLYGKGNPIYEFVDSFLRNKTTKMLLSPDLQKLTNKAYRLRFALDKMGLAGIVGANRFFRLDSNPHRIFDWYSAPIATHHTYDEVKEWFALAGLKVSATNEKLKKAKTPMDRILQHPLIKLPITVTVRGEP